MQLSSRSRLAIALCVVLSGFAGSGLPAAYADAGEQTAAEQSQQTSSVNESQVQEVQPQEEQPQEDLNAPGWHTDASGARYYMVAQGQRAEKGWLKDGDAWYYINADGTAQMGWLFWNSAWFYLTPDDGGRMATSVYEVDGARYLFDSNGYMQVGWSNDPATDKRAYASDSGALQSGWRWDGSGWYWLDSNSGLAATGWLDEGGARYHLSAPAGKMNSGWYFENGTWYLFAGSGAMQTGWHFVGGQWYYMAADGKMQTGIVQDGGASYLLRADAGGAMATGWAFDSSIGAWVYANGSGALHSGWLWDGAWYWLDPTTELMATGWANDGSADYFMYCSGAMASACWVWDADGWHYVNGSGACVSGWFTQTGKKYYLNPALPHNAMAEGFFTVDGVSYYAIPSSGELASQGWVQREDGSFVWVSDSGVSDLVRMGNKLYRASDMSTCLTDWVSVGNAKFYADPQLGDLKGGWADIEGARYYFDPSSFSMKTGWVNDGSWHYLDLSNGTMKIGWVKDGGTWYYIDSDGVMATGWREVDGQSYYLRPDWGGAMAASGTLRIDGFDRTFTSSGACTKTGYQNAPGYYQVSSASVASVPQGYGIFSYVTPSRIGANATRNDCVNAFIQRAYEYLGTPYKWNYACAPGIGVDCVGLVIQCAYAAGMDLGEFNPYNHWYSGWNGWHSHDANNMWNYGKVHKVSLGERQVGDVISWPGHVAIYIGNDQILEAGEVGAPVRIVSLWYWNGSLGTPRGCMRLFQ